MLCATFTRNSKIETLLEVHLAPVAYVQFTTSLRHVWVRGWT